MTKPKLTETEQRIFTAILEIKFIDDMTSYDYCKIDNIATSLSIIHRIGAIDDNEYNFMLSAAYGSIYNTTDEEYLKIDEYGFFNQDGDFVGKHFDELK